MNKKDILKAFFIVVNDSREWAIDTEEKNSNYVHYIDGVADMCAYLLDKLNNKNEKQED